MQQERLEIKFGIRSKKINPNKIEKGSNTGELEIEKN